MVEELLCVWCAFILLRGMGSRVVWDYKVCYSLSWYFYFFFRIESKKAYQEVAFGLVHYWLPQEGSNQYLVVIRRGT
jgi:hypothetical protein